MADYALDNYDDDNALQDRAIQAYLMRRYQDAQRQATDTNVPMLEPHGVPESGGVTGAVLDFLSNFERIPRGAATAVANIGKDKGFLGGLWSGLKLDKDSMMPSEALGLERGKPDDPWLNWLAKEGAILGTDVLLDPQTYAFAPAKAAGLLKSGIGIGPALLKAGVPEGKSLAGMGAKALGSDALSEYFYGTGIGKVLKSGLPKTEKYEPFRELQQQIEREGSKLPVLEAVAKARPEIEAGLKESPYNLLDVAHAAEYPGEVAADLSKIAEPLAPLKEMKNSGFTERNELLKAFGQEPLANLSGQGYEHLPHTMTPRGLIKLRRLGETEITPEAMKKGSREITRFLDNYGQVMTDELGEPIVGKLSDVRTREALGASLSRMGLPQDIEKQIRLTDLERTPASLRETAKIMPEGSMITDPLESLQQSIVGQRAQINTLKLMDALREQGWLINKNVQGAPGRDWRSLTIPGFKDWQTTPQIANWLENLSGVPTDPLGKSLQRLRQTPIGQWLEDATQWWKKNTLSGLGVVPYSLGNLISDTGNRYVSGQNPLQLGTRFAEALGVLGGKDPALLRELELRGLPLSSWSGSVLGEKAPTSSWLRDVGDDIPGVNKVMDTLGGVSEKWGALNNWLLQKSNQYVEAPGRVATAIDYLKKNAPGFDDLDPEVKSKILDRAVAFSKESLVDYGGLSATQRELQKIAVPFAGWQFGMPILAAQQAMKSPQRLARVDRFLNEAFMPMDPEDKAVAEPYMQEGAPVKGVAGWQFPRNEAGNDQILQLQRFLPWGSLEGLTKRPANNAWSAINPWLKTPMELGLDYSVFQGGPIDKLATGFGQSLTAPVTGAPYEESQGQWFGKNIPRGYEYLLGQSPAGRNTRTVNDLLRSTGVFQDPGKPIATSSLPVQVGSGVTQFATGSRFYGFDPDKQTRKRQLEQDRQTRQVKSDLKWARLMGNDAVADHYQEILDSIIDKGRVGFSEGL